MTTSQARRRGATRFHPMLGAPCTLLFFVGCVQVGPKDVALPGRVLEQKSGTIQRVMVPECHRPPELPPIPDVVHIVIEPDEPVHADAGGESLLRAYIAQREWLLKNR